jgi:hypothetical protein
VDRFPRYVAAALGIFMVVFGLWAFAAPRSFYTDIAGFGVYNLHLLHDVGSFQVGLGAALLAALVISDAITVVLIGGAAGSVLHAISHIIDRDLGMPNTKKEPIELSVVAVIIVIAALLSLRARRRPTPPS